MKKEFTWKMMKEFIDRQISEHGEDWLDNKLYIELVNPDTINKSFNTISDSEGWIYSEIMHHEGEPFCTRFGSEKKIVTLNINY